MIPAPPVAAWGDPCGVDREMDEETLSLLEGLHFHTLCEQNADASGRTLDAVEARFGDVLPGCNG